VDAPLGRCYWAVAPFSPRSPFRLYAGEGATPKLVEGPEPIVDAARRGMSEFVLLATVKARPVLVISSPLGPYDEVLALRLHRLEKIRDDDARDRVRRGEDDTLVWLRPERFGGLPVENAAIVSSLLRLPLAAIDRRRELGALNDGELRIIHERVARASRLRLDALVLARAQQLVHSLGAGYP
jgi:hypothetical protein